MSLAVTIRGRMGEPTCWLPDQTARIALPQLLALLDESAQPRSWSWADVVAATNRTRARKGLPPLKPRKR